MADGTLPKYLPRPYVKGGGIAREVATAKPKGLQRKAPMKASTKQLPRMELQRAGESMPKRSGTMKRSKVKKPSDAKNRSELWLAAVRSIPTCMKCGRCRKSQAAHQNQGKGIGWKVPDCLTAALCDECHFEIDNGSTLTLEIRRALLARAQQKTLVYLFTHDMIGATGP